MKSRTLLVVIMAYDFHHSRRVEFAETDAAGIAHFTSLFRYMEETEHAFLRSLGLSVVMQLDGQHISWPRVAASCSFSRPARFEDVLDVHLIVASKGRTSLSYRFLFSKDGQEIARGELKTVCCRITDHAPPQAIPLPSVFAERIEQAPLASATV